MIRVFYLASFFVLICLSAKGQNEFIGSLEYGNRSFSQRNFVASAAGDKLYVMSEWTSFKVDPESSEIEYIQQEFGTQLKVGDETLFLLRNPFGLYKPTSSGLELIHGLEGEDSYPYQYVSSNSAEKSFFRYRNTELWVTDGTTEGTSKFEDFNDPIMGLALIGDTIHCIIQSNSTLHHAINIYDRGESVSDVIGEIESNKLYGDSRFALKDHFGLGDEEGYYFYSLSDRDYRVIPISFEGVSQLQDAQSLKEIDGHLYGAIWNTWAVNDSRSNYIYRINVENETLDLIYSSPQPVYMRGYADIFDVDSNLLMLGNVGEVGSEVYQIPEGEVPELVKDIYPGKAGSLFNSTSSLFILHKNSYNQSFQFKDKLYFAAKSPDEGFEVWRTDGTETGTVRVSDFEPGPGGVHWVSLFSSGEELYCITRTGENILNFYQIDEEFAGFAESEDPEDIKEWDRYFFRDGKSYQNYMSVLREPSLVSTSKGFTGLLPGLRSDNPNYLDKFVDVDGGFSQDMPEYAWSQNANLLYFLREDGLIDTANFVIAEGSNCAMAVDSQTEEIFMTFGHKDETKFGNVEVRENTEATGLAKLSPRGELLWYKLFNNGRELFIHGIDVSSDKIFISGFYYGAFLNLGDGITLNSIYSQQYFTAAFDHSGNPIWAVNTSMEGLTRYSKLGQILVDEDNGIVYTASSEHSLNTWSSCGYGEWKIRLAATDILSGELVWNQDLVCDDLLRLRDMKTDRLGNLWLAGNFRGSLDIGSGKLRAGGDSDCPRNAFVALLNGKNGEAIKSFSTPEIHKRSRKILIRSDFVDVVYLNAFWEPEDALPPMAHKRVSYLEKTTYNLNGNLLGTERFPTPRGVYLGGYSNDEDASIKATICDVGSTYYALMLAYFDGGSLGLGSRRAPPFMGYKSATTIIKRPHPEFYFTENFDDEPYKSNGFSIYPNPVSAGIITLTIDPDRLDDFNTMTFTDTQGRTVWEATVDTRYYSKSYTLPPIMSGIYIVTLYGNDHVESQRLMISGR